MSRDFRLYLDDMLAAGYKVLRYTEGMTFEDFIADDKTFDAVVRNLQIIGEAAAKVPAEVRERHSTLPWAEIVGFSEIRNRQSPFANLQSLLSNPRHD